MTDKVVTEYNAAVPACDWDGVIKSYDISRIAKPDADLLVMELPPDSMADLVRILKNRDRVRVVTVEVPRPPTLLDAIFWGTSITGLAQMALLFCIGLFA